MNPRRMRAAALAALAVAALSGPARAQDDEVDTEKNRGLGEITASLRGGLSGYTGELSGLTGVGFSWGLQAAARPTRLLGVEVVYENASNSIQDPRAPDASLSRNGVQGLAKLYPPVEIGAFRPFVAAGVGLSYVTPQGAPVDLFTNDLVAELPLAAGLEYHQGALNAGVRATLSPLVGASFASQAGPGNPGGSVLQGLVQVGAQF